MIPKIEYHALLKVGNPNVVFWHICDVRLLFLSVGRFIKRAPGLKFTRTPTIQLVIELSTNYKGPMCELWVSSCLIRDRAGERSARRSPKFSSVQTSRAWTSRRLSCFLGDTCNLEPAKPLGLVPSQCCRWPCQQTLLLASSGSHATDSPFGVSLTA